MKVILQSSLQVVNGLSDIETVHDLIAYHRGQDVVVEVTTFGTETLMVDLFLVLFFTKKYVEKQWWIRLFNTSKMSRCHVISSSQVCYDRDRVWLELRFVPRYMRILKQ